MKKLYITLLALAFCLNGRGQIISTIAGSGPCATSSGAYSGDGGQATNAGLYQPWGLAFDNSGNLYIVDGMNNRIRKVNTSGVINTIAGNGTVGNSGDGGQATSAELNNPEEVTFDAAGNLYIADYGNNRIRKVTTAGVISTYAGNGVQGYNGDGGAATVAKLYNPAGLAFDAAGNLYFSDANNNRIRMVNTSGIISTIAGSGIGGYSGDGGAAAAAKISFPQGLAFDAIGNLYIADDGNNCVRKVTTTGIISTVAGNGTYGYSGDGSAATAAELKSPTGLILDAAGNLYIADWDNARIRKVNTVGIISTIAGNGTIYCSGDGGAATAAELDNPASVVFDATGNLYIADEWNNRIRKVTNVGQAAGIEQFPTNNEQVSIYPNPNNGSFVIEPNSATKQTVQVYDVNGKLVLSQTINGKTNIDASTLSEGVYNISLQSTEGVVNKRLVIVR